MAVLVPSAVCGAGFYALTSMMKPLKIASVIGDLPSPSLAALYGTAVHLAHRVVVAAAQSEFKGRSYTALETHQRVVLVVALQILFSYAIRDLFNAKVPLAFAHCMNLLYVAALADGEYENLAKQVFPIEWKDHVDQRRIVLMVQNALSFLH